MPGEKIIPDSSASAVSINSREDGDLNFLPPFFFFFLKEIKQCNTQSQCCGLCQLGSFAGARAWLHISADQITVLPAWARVIVHSQYKQFLSLLYSTAAGSFMLSVIWFPCWSHLGSVGRTVLDSLSWLSLCCAQLYVTLRYTLLPGDGLLQGDFWAFNLYILFKQNSLQGYPDACFTLGTVLRAAAVQHKSQHFGRLPKLPTPSSMSNVGFLTATGWTKKKAYLRFQSSFSFFAQAPLTVPSWVTGWLFSTGKGLPAHPSGKVQALMNLVPTVCLLMPYLLHQITAKLKSQ